MREILFRGKKCINDEWIEGLFVEDKEFYGVPDNHAYIVEHKHPSGCFGSDIYFEVDPETVGQYTGLTDKNGTKIFEGDIVKLRLLAAKMERKGVCEYRNGAFGLAWQYAGERYCTFAGTCNAEYEVLGNIHDNPELMEDE